MTDEIKQAIERAVSRAFPPAVMSMDDIAALLDYSRSHVAQEIVCRPDFPQPLPNFKQPRYARDEVLKYVGVKG